MVTSLSVASAESEEDILQDLKRKLEEMARKQNQLKTKVSKLEGDLLYKATQMKAMKVNVECLEDHGRKLAAGNESRQVTKRKSIALPIYRSRPKGSAEATKMIAEMLGDHYVGTGIHFESMCNVCCVKEFTDLQPFSNPRNRNREMR